MNKKYIARKRIDDASQSLYEHSKNVAEISLSLSQYPNISKLLAYLHDLGKLSAAFQNYIQNNEGERGSVIHAWQGAFLANELFPNDSTAAVLLKEIIGFCVTAHHNHLDDGIAPDSTTNYFDKFLNTDAGKYSFAEIKARLSETEKEELQKLFEHAKPEINGLLLKINTVYKMKDSAHFALGLFIKYLFSCLVDADRLDAYLFEINEKYAYQTYNWAPLINTFEKELAKFPIRGEIDMIRKSVSDKCKTAADKKSGIYQLSVPTGGGKTLSSLRFALHHAKKHGKKRIIYVIPYLSIIEQTADTLNDILNLPKENDVLFEHHSNIMEPEDEKAAEIRKLTASRWDSPIILTTMVQFLESVMSAKSSKLRKFASMADSVIIFDEIQSMPIKAIHCFNEVATFLSNILNATIILCSATQPTLESTQRENLLLQENAQLINGAADFQGIKRVNIAAEEEKDSEAAADFILEKAKENGNCLAIMNTKKSVGTLYNHLKTKAADFRILHLSTSMCSAHRGQTIHDMKRCLKNNEKIICISTQLIEAGVDISFSCVVRAMAGLDSIAQAAGRCNRNGESPVPKSVYTFPLKDENLDKLEDIKSGKEITSQMIQSQNKNIDLLDEKIMRAFYELYFAGKDSQMEYPIKNNETVYSMLAGNSSGRNNYENRTGKPFSHCIAHAFHSAGESFNVIDKNTKTIVVLFGKAERLIEEYRKQPAGKITKEKIVLLKKLQEYSVSLYEYEWKRLGEQNAFYLLDEETEIIVLSKNYYSPETGIVLESNPEDYIF